MNMNNLPIGFSNDAVVTIGSLFLVIGGVERSHAVDWLTRKTFGTVGNDTIGKARMYITCFMLSIFFNNTPLVSILLPVVKDWGRMRKIPGFLKIIMRNNNYNNNNNNNNNSVPAFDSSFILCSCWLFRINDWNFN